MMTLHIVMADGDYAMVVLGGGVMDAVVDVIIGSCQIPSSINGIA